MKLYTEEQVLKMLDLARFTYNSEDKILLSQIPIQIPSDEEIEQEAYYKVSDHTENPYASFKSGAKWMKEQILNQNEG